MVKSKLHLAKLKDPNFVRNVHKLDGTYSSKTPNAFAGYQTHEQDITPHGYYASPGGGTTKLPPHMYKSNQAIPTLNNSMPMGNYPNYGGQS